MSSMSSITLIHSEIYVPDFNENTDEYIDKCPINLTKEIVSDMSVAVRRVHIS